MSKFKYTGNQTHVLTKWDGKGNKRKPTDIILSKGDEVELPEKDPKVLKLIALGRLEEIQPTSKATKGGDEKKSTT